MANQVSLNTHNLELVHNLSMLGLDMEDIAPYFGMSDNQLKDLCEKHPEFFQMYDEGRSVRDKSNTAERHDG